MKSTFLFSLINVFFTSFLFSNNVEQVFNDIYQSGAWGRNEQGTGNSGPGSSVGQTALYRFFLQNFLQEKNIKTVLDVGCGDWEFSRLIDWTNREYFGVDVVESVIINNLSKYASKNIRFALCNAINMELPKADLLLCKDVLQHLSNEDISLFINQLSKYKYCLITNDVDPHSLSSENYDILAGQHRELDLTKPPFMLNGLKVLSYISGDRMKQVLFVDNEI